MDCESRVKCGNKEPRGGIAGLNMDLYPSWARVVVLSLTNQ